MSLLESIVIITVVENILIDLKHKLEVENTSVSFTTLSAASLFILA